jgi:hypothetical protein
MIIIITINSIVLQMYFIFSFYPTNQKNKDWKYVVKIHLKKINYFCKIPTNI